MFKEKESNFISFVGYIHNNKNDIEPFVKMCCEFGDTHFTKYEIILVDDRSKDGSVDKIKAVCSNSDCVVSVVKMSYFQGIDRSLSAGTDFSIGDYVFEFENIEIDYSSSLLMDAYRKLLEGNDIVSVSPKGSKTTRNKIFYSVYNLYKPNENNIVSTRFRLVSRRAINRVSSINMKVIYRKAVFADCGLGNAVIYYQPTCKIDAKNKREQSKASASAYESMLVFTNVSVKIASIICAIMFIIGFGFLGNIIYSACLNLVINELFIILCFVSLFFGLTNISIIFMINYTSLVVSSQFRKKEYLIENIEKVNKK